MISLVKLMKLKDGIIYIYVLVKRIVRWPSLEANNKIIPNNYHQKLASQVELSQFNFYHFPWNQSYLKEFPVSPACLYLCSSREKGT